MDLLCLQHAYRDGRTEEVVLRHLGSEDGNTVIAKDIRSFFCLQHAYPDGRIGFCFLFSFFLFSVFFC